MLESVVGVLFAAVNKVLIPGIVGLFNRLTGRKAVEPPPPARGPGGGKTAKKKRRRRW